MVALQDLVQIVARLRGEGGCPWDRAQTPGSMRPYLLEETYEVLHALDADAPQEIEGELGDLLFIIALIARMGEEGGRWSLEGALTRAAHKMVVRHPHVFPAPGPAPGAEAGAPAEPAEDAALVGGLAAWEARKAKERPQGSSALDGVPSALPALLRAHRVSEKAASVGFDWPDAAGVRLKLSEEVAELDEAISSGDADAIGEELGDVLFTLVNLGRHLPVGAETALRTAVTRFEERFRALEQALAAKGAALEAAPPEVVERVWREVKERRR